MDDYKTILYTCSNTYMYILDISLLSLVLISFSAVLCTSVYCNVNMKTGKKFLKLNNILTMFSKFTFVFIRANSEMSLYH